MSKSKPTKRELEDRILALEMQLTLLRDAVKKLEAPSWHTRFGTPQVWRGTSTLEDRHGVTVAGGVPVGAAITYRHSLV